MANIEWTDRYSVKVAELDDHHKKLITLINTLKEHMSSGKGNEAVAGIVDELFDYTKKHFSIEEKYMQQCSYENYESHKHAHETFVKKVEDFRNDIHDNKIVVSINVLSFLVDWLIKHILNTDKQYTELFNANGIK